MKKLIAFLVFAIAAICAYAQTFEYEGLNYNILSEAGKTCEVARNPNASGDITIPGTVTYGDSQYTVTSIGDEAFLSCRSLASVTLPESLTSIGNSAFSWCSRLTSITLPESLTSIRRLAFYNCYSLASISLPESLTSIGDQAFLSCESLTSITLPESLNSIEYNAFWRCYNLTSIYVAAENKNYASIDGVLFSKDLTELITCPAGKSGEYTVPNGVTSIGYAAFYDCYSLISITLPDSLNSIGGYAFYDCYSLTSMTLPGSITSIGNQAFYYCTGLTSINLPESLTSIGDGAFLGCSSLTSINLPESLTSIGRYAFCYCTSLTAINVAAENKYYASIDGVLFSKDITSLITCPAGKSGEYTVPNGVTSVGSRAFYYCSNLTSITLPESLTSIGDETFYYCSSLTSINVAAENKNYASIYGVLFSKDLTVLIACPTGKLGKYTVPNGVTSIGYAAFYSCEGLASITLPESLTSIGNSAFYYCSSLATVYSKAKNPPVCGGNDVFYAISSDAVLHVPAGCKDDYASATGWSVFNTIVDVQSGIDETFFYKGLEYKILSETDKTCEVAENPNALGDITIPETVTYGDSQYTVTSIGDRAFYNCTSLATITLPESLTSIGDAAFYNCTSLATITLPESITSIGVEAFAGCTSLTSITLPESLTSIGEGAFAGCTSLTEITLPESLTSIGYSAFYNCDRLTSITLPQSLTSIGDGAFAGCTSLTEINVAAENKNYASIDGVLFSKDLTVLIAYPGGKPGEYTVPNGVTSIGEYAFYSCTSLTSITLPESLTSIGNTAFYGCTSLTSITLPDSLTSIGDWAFAGCESLTSITLPESLTSIGYAAFYSCKSLTSITLPKSITSIGNDAFAWCYSLASITLPESLNSIGNFAFYRCKSLTSITLPKSITSIGDRAFAGCESLTTVNSYATNPPVCGGYEVFNAIPSDAVLHVPVGFKDDYATAKGWSVFNTIIDDLIATSGVDEIERDTETGDADDLIVVYNLQGHRMNISSRSELPTLPAGIYIINGKKQLVK